jgi:hypothetical protein
MMPKTIVDTWLERVEAPEMPESIVRQFKNAVAARAEGDSFGGMPTKITEADAKRIMLAFRLRVARDGGPLVTEAQADKGREWIARYGKRLGILEEYRTGITHFRLRGIRVIPHPTYEFGRKSFAPIYRAYYADGRTMTYSPTPWTARDKAVAFTYQEAA